MAAIKTTVNNLPENKVELQIEVPPDELQARIDRTVKEMGKDVKLPGFRPGKAPRQVIVSRFGKEAIYAHTLEDSVPVWVDQAMVDARIKPVAQPELDLNPIEDEEAPYSFKATLDVIPRPELGKYTGIEVEKDVADVTDAEIEEQVDGLRKRLASLEPVEGRAATEGDYVLIDFTGYVDGEELDGGSSKDYMLELGSGQFIPGFEEKIKEMKTGESKKLELKFPDDYQPENLAGKDVQFEVTLKEIKERVLPEANDEFAAENSEVETMEELRGMIRDRLKEQREQEAEALFQQRAVNNIVDEAKVEIPEAAVATRAHELEMDFISQLQSRGMSPEMYVRQSEEDKQRFQEHFMKQADSELRREAVLETVADNEDIEVSDAEVEEEIRMAAPRMGEDPDKLVRKMREKGRFPVVRDDILRRKAAEHITGHAIPVPKANTEKESAGVDKTEGVPEEIDQPEAKIIKP